MQLDYITVINLQAVQLTYNCPYKQLKIIHFDYFSFSESFKDLIKHKLYPLEASETCASFETFTNLGHLRHFSFLEVRNFRHGKHLHSISN